MGAIAYVAAAAIGAIGSAVSSNNSKNASKSASGASKSAAARTLAEQQRQFDLTRADQAKWRAFGEQSLGNLSNPLANFYESPDYQFRKAQGMEGIAQSKALGGLLKSGSALADTLNYNSNLAAGEYDNWYNRQLAGAGLGQTANAANQAAGQAYANSVGQVNQWNAANQMQSAYAQANANNQLIGNLTGLASNLFANWGGFGGYSGGYGGSGSMPTRTG